MKTTSLISSSLIFSSALCLSSCDDGLEPGLDKDQEESKQLVISTLQPPADLVVNRQEQSKGESRVVESVVRKQQADKQVDLANERSENQVSEESQQQEPVVLDFSLNFKQMDLSGISNIPGSNGQDVLRGIFESEGVAFNVEMEPHFSWPHNENKEKEATPDGAGIKLKIDF